MNIQERVNQLAAESYEDGSGLLNDIYYRCGGGSYRAVLLDHENGIAFKLVRREAYIDHNMREWDLYHEVSPEVQAMMAKPLAISPCGRVLAMELIPKTVGNRFPYDRHAPFYVFEQQQERILKVLEEFDKDLGAALRRSQISEDRIQHLLDDNHASNVGIRDNGQLAWIDYASYSSKPFFSG